MVSRRAVLAGAGTCTLAGLGGLVSTRSIETGRLARKTISVEVDRDGGRYAFNVVNVLYADTAQTVFGTVVEKFAGAYDPPATVRVDRALHDRLTDKFDQVAYYLYFETNGEIGGRVSRSDFNRAELGDDVDVFAPGWLDASPPNRVVDASGRNIRISDQEVATVPLSDVSGE